MVCNVGFEPSAAFPTRPGGPTTYEIQFRVARSVVDGPELQAILSSLGTDVVVASSTEHLAAHVHVSDPHAATRAISAQLESRPTAKAISYDVEAIVGRGDR
jgi:hypothetical protein